MSPESRHADNRSDRRHAVGVDEEQHVVARRREIGGRRRLNSDLARAGREVEELEALVLVERVSDGGQPNQGDLRDLRGVRRRDVEARAVACPRWRRRDRRSRTLEEVRRRIDLGVLLVDDGAARQRTAAGHQDSAVGEKQRGRVVFPAVLQRRDRGPRLRVRIPDLGGKHRLREVCAVGRRHAAARENRPVRKKRQVFIRAPERHRARFRARPGSRSSCRARQYVPVRCTPRHR